MGVGAGFYMYSVIVKKVFTFAISSPDEFLVFQRCSPVTSSRQHLIGSTITVWIRKITRTVLCCIVYYGRAQRYVHTWAVLYCCFRFKFSFLCVFSVLIKAVLFLYCLLSLSLVWFLQYWVNRFSGVARGGFGRFKLPIEKCQKISEDKIVDDTQSWICTC